MKTWTLALIAALVVLVPVAAVGGYMIGSAAGEQRANSVRAEFMAQRFGQAQGNTQGPGQAQAGGTPGFAARGGAGTNGTVKSIDGNTIVVTTASGEVQVRVTADTPVTKMSAGTLKDIQPGMRITVIGEPAGSGVVTARSIQLMPSTNP